MAFYIDAMKNYIKPTLLALLISTACAFAKDENAWVSSRSPFFPNTSGSVTHIVHITTSQDGLIIHVVAKLGGDYLLHKTTDGGVTWFVLRQK